jgi:hypothetical protein
LESIIFCTELCNFSYEGLGEGGVMSVDSPIAFEPQWDNMDDTFGSLLTEDFYGKTN